MSFTVRCPHCPTTIDLSEQALSATCPRCATTFKPVPSRNSSLAFGISLWGLAGASLAALAVVLASLTGRRWLTIFAAALGLAAVLIGIRSVRGKGGATSRFSLAVGGILCAGVLLMTVWAPGVLNPFWTMDSLLPPSDPDLQVTVPRGQPFRRGKPIGENDWVDVGTEGIRQDNLYMRVESVVAGRLLEKGATTYLLVNFRLDQIEVGGTPAFERYLPGKIEPSLTDDSGHSYAFLWDRVRKEPTKFDLLLKVDHLLVFELPPSRVASLKLTLPATAWGRQGVCRFRISTIAQQESSPDMAKLVAETKAMLRSPPAVPPDPTLGRALFAKTCQECHTLYGFGAKVGPDLTASKRGDFDFLVTSIVDPSAVIEKQYQPTTIETTKGLVLHGIVKQADTDAVTLHVPDRLVVVPRNEIERMEESKVSLMPTELLKPMNEHEVRSLIAYLSGKSQVPMLATPDFAPYYFFSGQDLNNWHSAEGIWKVERGEIVPPEPQDGKPALLISDLHLPDDFHLTLRIKSGQTGRGAVLLRDAGHPDRAGGPRVEFAAGATPALVAEKGKRFLQEEQFPAADSELKAEAWNKLEIIVADDRILVRLNDKDVMSATETGKPSRRAIALEGPSVSGQEIRFRNPNIRLLPQRK